MEWILPKFEEKQLKLIFFKLIQCLLLHYYF